MKNKTKKIIYVTLTGAALFFGAGYWVDRNNTPDNGIHVIGANAVVIEGEVVVINWDASDVEADSAMALYRRLK